LLKLDSRDGHKRNHIGRPDAGMDAFLPGQVNQLDRLACTTNCCFNHGTGLACNRHHGTVVVGIH
jgi:hypothetical protein